MILNITDTEEVSPLVQNKGLDRSKMRSSVFMADMTCIALRSKIQSKRMVRVWFGFSVRLWIVGCVGLFGAMIVDCKTKN